MPVLDLYNNPSDLQTSFVQIGSVQIAELIVTVVDSDVEKYGELRKWNVAEVKKLDSWLATRNWCFSVGVTGKTSASANHCRADIAMPQQPLYGPDIVSNLQKMRGERMAY